MNLLNVTLRTVFHTSIAAGSISVASAAQFVETPITNSTAYKALAAHALNNGKFFLFASQVASPFSIKNFQNNSHESGVFASPFPAPANGSDLGGISSDPYFTYYSQNNSATGTAYTAGFSRFTEQNLPSTPITDPGGPVVAVPNGASAFPIPSVGCMLLYEVQPAFGPRTIILHTYKPGSFNQKRYFSMLPGDSILDATPRKGGGLLFLTGTTSAASMNYIDKNGVRHGPFIIGPASQIEYSSVNGGTVFTAGKDAAGNMFFTRSPLDGSFTDSNIEPLPFANEGFSFICSGVMIDGTCWWGGSYTKPRSDKNGFIVATRNTPALSTFGSQEAGTQSFDESVHSIAMTDHGLAMWAGDGVACLFNTSDGSPYQSYPAVPNANLHFVSASASPKAEIYYEPYSAFAAVAYDSVSQTSFLLKTLLRGEPSRAYTTMPAYVGGASPTIVCQVYDALNGPHTLPASTTSTNVTVPATVTFPNGVKTVGLRVDTQPVAAEEDIVVSIGAPRAVTAKFRLLPPTPASFAPASQTVIGGSTTLSRLSLNGKTPMGGLNVGLTSDGSEVSVPAVLLVPSGLYSRSFVIHTTPVGGAVTRTITATYNGISKTTDITVTP